MGVLQLLECPRVLAAGAVTTIHGPHEPGQRQQGSGYNGTSDITASAPPPASWRGRGRARASASGYKVLMTEAQEASYTAAASERVFPVLQLSLSSVFRLLIVVTMPGLVQLSCLLAAAAQVQAWGGVFNR